jgi:hypothetical protein
MAHGKRHDSRKVRRKKNYWGVSPSNSGIRSLYPQRHGRHDRLTIPVEPVVNPIT